MKVLITDGISPEGAKILTDAGHDVDQVKFTPEELLANIAKYDCIIVRSATKVTKDVIEAGKNLKVIGRGGVGLDNIDVECAKSKNLKVLNTPGASAISVAELAIAHMFALGRFLNVSKMEMVAGKWPKKEYSKGIELSGKTLGVMGFGSIGKEVARRGLGLGMKVIAYDPVFTPADFVVQTTTREKLLAESDFITLHIPLDKKSGPAIGKQEFEMMKKGAIVVNCARGGVVDESALLEALESGKLAGAGLDVFANEPPAEAQQALMKHPKVSVSPHVGGSTVEGQERVGIEIAQRVVKALSPGA
ncbi:MAG TPA: 3-phosphoglycerate dehydrogenase [Bacteroidetes bacterium]|nr:3-phosphoglycerate dehydrogenase [Bacteroidota bacterium]